LFAYWEKNESSVNDWATFSSKVFTVKDKLGYILGDLITNSSCHPGCNSPDIFTAHKNNFYFILMCPLLIAETPNLGPFIYAST
jgi:hypothetical protein